MREVEHYLHVYLHVRAVVAKLTDVKESSVGLGLT
jgi:hypothetical protein